MKHALLMGLLLGTYLPIGYPLVRSSSEQNPQPKTPPIVSLEPRSVDFGDRATKTASKPQRITVTNTGEKSLYINSVSITGDNREDFLLGRDTCTGATISQAKSCIIDVSFTPTTTGTRSAAVTITDNAVDSPQTVTLTGNGINPVRVPPRE